MSTSDSTSSDCRELASIPRREILRFMSGASCRPSSTLLLEADPIGAGVAAHLAHQGVHVEVIDDDETRTARVDDLAGRRSRNRDGLRYSPTRRRPQRTVSELVARLPAMHFVRARYKKQTRAFAPLESQEDSVFENRASLDYAPPPKRCGPAVPRLKADESRARRADRPSLSNSA